MSEDKYECALCGETFEKCKSEEEALAELHEQFGEDVSVEECDIVCDVEIFEEWKANKQEEE